MTKSPTGWSVGGELDAHSKQQLAAAFADLPELHDGRLDLDAGDVSFIDSGGLGALIALRTRVCSAGGVLVIRNPSPPVRRLLAITQLDALFGVNGTDAR